MKRGKLEKVRDMLKIIRQHPKGIVKTRILGAAGMNFVDFAPYFDRMVKENIIAIVPTRRLKEHKKYCLTQKGMELLTMFNEIEKEMFLSNHLEEEE